MSLAVWPRAQPAPGAGLAAEGREGVVKARLSLLLAELGELSAARGRPAAVPWGSLAGALDDICDRGTLVLHGRVVPGRAVPVEHLVVAPRGLVVVGPAWAGVNVNRRPDPFAPRPTRSAGRPTAAPPGVVRETLRAAYSLRTWLDATCWSGTPVLAAVCTGPAEAPRPGVPRPPVPGGPAPARLPAVTRSRPPLVLDALWMGLVGQLADWLESGDALDGVSREALGYFLADELPLL